LPNNLRANVKLDREECPDLDRLDQRTHQSLTTREARPLTVLLTPDDHAPFSPEPTFRLNRGTAGPLFVDC